MRERLYINFVIGFIVSICIGCERQHYDAQTVGEEDKIEIMLYKSHLLHIKGEDRGSFCNDLSLFYENATPLIAHLTLRGEEQEVFTKYFDLHPDRTNGECRLLVDLLPGIYCLEQLFVTTAEGDTLFSAVPVGYLPGNSSKSGLPLQLEISDVSSESIPTYTVPVMCMEEIRAAKFAFETTTIEFVQLYGILFNLFDTPDSSPESGYSMTLSALLRTEADASWFLLREGVFQVEVSEHSEAAPLFYFSEVTTRDDLLEGYLIELDLPRAGLYEGVFSVAELIALLQQMKEEKRTVWDIFYQDDSRFYLSPAYPDLPGEPFF